MKNVRLNKTMIATILALAWPTMLEQLMQTAVQYIDTAMVGSLGTHATAAVGATTTVNWLVGSTISALGVGFLSFIARAYGAGENPERPVLVEKKTAYTLPELELYYRKLDLYFSFCKAFGCPVDEDDLYEKREDVAEEINEILLHRLKNNIRFCASCGKALPLHHKGRLCEGCFQKSRSGGPAFHKQHRRKH